MEDAGRVRCRQRVRDLNGVLQRVLDTQSGCAPMTSASDVPGDVLHRDEVDALGLSDVIDRDDVRVIQRGGGSGFLDESLPALSRRSARQGGAA